MIEHTSGKFQISKLQRDRKVLTLWEFPSNCTKTKTLSFTTNTQSLHFYDEYCTYLKGDSFNYPQSTLLAHNNHRFSTPDHDRDNSFLNCAQILQSGWWFNSCYRFTSSINVYLPWTFLSRSTFLLLILLFLSLSLTVILCWKPTVDFVYCTYISLITYDTE